MFLLNLRTLRAWFLMTEYEMFLNVLSVFVATLLLALKIDSSSTGLTWLHVFLPLFIVEGLQVYFLFMVAFRFYYESKIANVLHILLVCAVVVTLKFLAKLLLYLNTTHTVSIKYALTSLPVFFILIFLLFRSCTLNRKFNTIE
jgi:hypothetical protein